MYQCTPLYNSFSNPLLQLVYQTFVFISRSSISIGLPALPRKLLPLPAILQSLILLTLILESSIGLFGSTGSAVPIVFFLISMEGLCGGSA